MPNINQWHTLSLWYRYPTFYLRTPIRFYAPRNKRYSYMFGAVFSGHYTFLWGHLSQDPQILCGASGQGEWPKSKAS